MKWLHTVSIVVLILILALLYGLSQGDGTTPAAGAPAAPEAPRSYQGLGK